MSAQTMPVVSKLTRATCCVVAFCSFALAQSLSPAADVHSEARDGRIEVHLDADGLAPRPIEELTGATIARHYALAWQNLAQALESSNADGLGDEFTGFAKEHLTKRIAEQKQTGVRTRIVDHGHRLKAIFYSSDGAAMQLLDLTQLEIQTFDGSKLLDTQNAPHTYIVVLTPGADRWYIRDLEEVSAKP